MSRSSITALLLSCALLVLAFACHSTLAQETATEETPSTTLTVYHQKDGQYIKRGTIVGLPSVPEYIPYDHEIVSFKNKKEPFYQIKVKDERTGNIILSSIKMCQMVASDWQDKFTLHLDEDNQFYYLSYYPESNYCQEKLEYPITTKPFTTSIQVVKPVAGPKPLTGNFLAQQQKQQAKTKKATANVNDEVPDTKEIEEKSFFQNYWYLILGGAFLLMSAAAPPPEEGAGAPAAGGARR